MDTDRILLELSQSSSRIEQGLKDLNERLYNGGTGAIPVLFELSAASDTEMKKALARHVELQNTIRDVDTRIDTVESLHKEKRAYAIGYGAGIGTGMSLLVKWGLGKLGFHF